MAEIALNKDYLLSFLKKKGFSSIQDIAERLNIHRNTLSLYLNDHSPVAKPVAALIELSGAPLSNVFSWRSETNYLPYEPITKEIDTLKQAFPDFAFVLFGSRTKGKEKKYSDFDIGVFRSGEQNIKRFLALIRKKEELENSSPYMIQIIDLNHADTDFLTAIAPTWIFLGGSLEAWTVLNKSLHANDRR